MPPTSRQANLVVAAGYGALVALVLGYGASYFIALLGAGIISGSSQADGHGVGTIMRAGLNLYAMLCTRLVGEGRADGGAISAAVTLPLSLWVLVPVTGLIIGGYASGRLRAGSGRWSIVLPAVLGGLFYAGMLAALSPVFGARVEPSALPSFEGFEFNPPPIIFRASPLSALVAGAIFGVVSTYIGGLAALRADRPREERPGRWWASAKALALVVVLVQAILAAGIVFLFFSRPAPGEDEGVGGLRFIQMLPSATGIGYTLAHGSTLRAGMESAMPGFESSAFQMSYSANLYSGTTTRRGSDVDQRPVPPYLYAFTVLAAAALWLAGWLAVRWGSRDGIVPTAVRLTLLHTLYLAFALWACRILWQATETRQGFSSQYEVFIAPQFELTMLAAVFVVFLITLAGAAFGMGRERMSGFTLP